MERDCGDDMMFMPNIGDLLVVTMPGETVRVPVMKVIDRDTVFVSFDVQTVSRQHSYRRGDIVPVRRTIGELGESWHAIDERSLPSPCRRKKTHANA